MATSTGTGAGPTMVRRQLGRRLRALRTTAGKTQEDVAVTRLMSLGKLKGIEHGRSMIRPGDVYELGMLYGADPETITELRALAAATTQDGWWQEYTGGLFKGFAMYVDLEAAAARLSVFQPVVIAGLLQTEDYALAVDIATTSPSLGQDIIRKNVRLRTQRLPGLLRRVPPPRIDVILGEAALQLPVGGTAVMTAQLAHLRRLNTLDNVTINVLRQAVGPHRGLLGAFTVLDFDDEDDPSVTYTESQAGARYDDRSEPLARHREVFAALSASATPLEEHLDDR